MNNVRFEILQKQDVEQFSSVLQTIWQGLQHLYSPEAQLAETENWTPLRIEERLSHPDSLLIAGKVERQIIAARVAEFEANTLFLYLSGVLPQYQKQGIGTQLHHFTFECLRRDYPHVHKVWCDTIASNAAGIAVLRKIGYEQEAHLKRHWYGDDYFLWGYWLR